MKFRITYKVQTGKNKSICEDSLYDGYEVVSDKKGSVCVETPIKMCVADGVGGNAGGEKASKYVLQRVQEIECFDSIENLRSELVRINVELLTYARESEKLDDMATTFTGIFINEEKVYLAHCGNTRLYVMKGNYLKQITEDHSTYQWLISSGNQSAAESCNKSEILSAFGGGKSSYLDKLYVTEVFERGIPNRMVLTTDGIHDYVSEDEMEDIISAFQAEEVVEKLVAASVEHGSSDDCTVAIIEKVEDVL